MAHAWIRIKDEKYFFYARERWNKRATARKQRNIAIMIGLMANGPIKQTEIAKIIGVSQPTVSGYLKEIKKMGICECCGQTILNFKDKED